MIMILNATVLQSIYLYFEVIACNCSFIVVLFERKVNVFCVSKLATHVKLVTVKFI